MRRIQQQHQIHPPWVELLDYYYADCPTWCCCSNVSDFVQDFATDYECYQRLSSTTLFGALNRCASGLSGFHRRQSQKNQTAILELTKAQLKAHKVASEQRKT